MGLIFAELPGFEPRRLIRAIILMNQSIYQRRWPTKSISIHRQSRKK